MEKSALIVVPCYNEDDILESSSQKLLDELKSLIDQKLISNKSKVCFVDDGSSDHTWDIISTIIRENPLASGIKLSKNFGHQSAVLAGLLENIDKYAAFITIDADLQDDISVIKEMINSFLKGNHVVYGVRNDRSSDSLFKRITAEAFYKVMKKMGVPTVFNHADFRLMSNSVIKELRNYKEVNLFIRGIIPTIGFSSEKVFYARKVREAGESKYPLSKMLSFAWNGITSFSTTPMRLVLWFGILNFLIALVITGYVIASKVIGTTVQGWTSTLLPMAYFSGSNMIALGLIGEYLGKVYQEIKARPRYIIEEHID